MRWYIQALKKYAVFSGRSRRREYWMFGLIHVPICVALVLIDLATGMTTEGIGIGVLSGLYSLGMLLPSLAVTVRRLHDTNRSGWWMLINCVPILGSIILLVFSVLDGDAAANRFGPNPKAMA